MKYRIKFCLRYKYDVAYDESQEEDKLYTREINLATNENPVKMAEHEMNSLADYKNKMGFDGEIVGRRLIKITRIDQEEVTTDIPLS